MMIDYMVNLTKADRMRCRKSKLQRKETPLILRILYKLIEYLVIFLIGGCVYYCIEILWRGYSHYSMFILGGLCLIIIGLLNEGLFPEKFGLISQMLMGSVIITVLEFITGMIVNVWMGLNIWDYSDMPLNIMGQICLPFTIAWFFISGVAIIVDDMIRHTLFDEPWPQYEWWMMKEE